MSQDLIIVESPAKVKTISKFLGAGYEVQASKGHIRDLPKATLGVDEEHDFAPHYEISKDKEKIVATLCKAAAQAKTVYLAPDPDREGEAIAWHVAQIIQDKASDIKRIEFNEITARAVKEALSHPRSLNKDLIDAQQARRVLDRLVGYKISPLLWKTIKRGISAGRVQSVTLRLIVERERERNAFKPEEYWIFTAKLAGKNPPPFQVQLQKIAEEKAEIHNEVDANALLARLKDQKFLVQDIAKKERSRKPQPPLITSTLQQAANQRFGYTSKRTMSIAQKLYEGVELNVRGLTALITYMRTDSTRIADEAKEQAKKYIINNFGPDFLPKKPNDFKVKKSAQDAHEAIRPVDLAITPEMIRSSVSAEMYNLYQLIYSRFVASQMAPALVEDTIILVACQDTLWRAHGERILFPGFLQVLPKAQANKDETVDLPKLEVGESLDCLEMPAEQKFTQPPARFSEASIVKEMEENGIGRPSTYATTVSTLMDRAYIEVKDRHIIPTELGIVVTDQLIENFPTLMDVNFTAQMEENLDKVALGEENWVKLMESFAENFNPSLEAAAKNMKSVKKGLEAHLDCPTCGKPLMIKFGKAGSFLACSAYPNCRFTSNFVRNDDGTLAIVERPKEELETVGVCPKCGKALVVKKAHSGGRFIACTGYPDCDYVQSFSTNVICPQCHEGEIVERSSKRGKIFYSCSRYPACDFALWNQPINESCPECGSSYLLEKRTRQGTKFVCPNKKCGFSKDLDEGEE
ncbi:MAG: type I DNA topoisomerase [Desulfovibrionaceae bacterium]|nr:type I DNA topoisomerase [Desulfovibrionaceae bacterium]